MKKKIVVVEPMSSAFNFLEDIRDRGYEPVILETYIPYGYARKMMDDEEMTKREFELLMLIEEKYPNLLYSNTPLFLPPEDDSELTTEIRDILNRDTETLIHDIISFYKNGSKGNLIVPEKLINANQYNKEIMELLKEISGV